MSSPFEDDSAQYRVLVNDEGQHSLWPVFAKTPAGWTVVHGPATRQDCLDHVERVWTDMRPASLVQAMNA
ncbi:MbtH family protein [Streptomyces sp. YGL11-2]|uniref:MbtH family protein n=1 Tax=Streptomyces sp. YGL11-2 TaxID=3414028 RepID=UPI003CF4DC4B